MRILWGCKTRKNLPSTVVASDARSVTCAVCTSMNVNGVRGVHEHECKWHANAKSALCHRKRQVFIPGEGERGDGKLKDSADAKIYVACDSECVGARPAESVKVSRRNPGKATTNRKINWNK